jgi:PAS domain S-box-containing protein
VDDRPITAVSFPSEDLVFAERVREALRDVDKQPVDEAMDEMRRRLGAVHPAVETRLRQDIAGFGGTPVVYVFRDGLTHQGLDDEWTKAASTARVVTDRDGTYVSANEPAGRLFGVRPDDIIGRPAGTFTRPDSRIEDADALWAALEARGRLHSLALIRCPDGAERTVEFVTIKDGDGPGRNVTLLRETGDARLSTESAAVAMDDG